MKRNYINIISIFFMLQSANFTQTAQTERLVRIIDVIKALPKNNADSQAEAARKAQEEKARAASARKEKTRILYERAAAAHERIKACKRDRQGLAFQPSNFRQIFETFEEELRALEEEKMILNEINVLALEIEERYFFEENRRAHFQRYDEYAFSRDKFNAARRRYEDDARRRSEEDRRRREDDARRGADEEARRQAEEERRRHEDDARRGAEEGWSWSDYGLNQKVKDAFKVFGLQSTATEEEIKKTYKKLSLLNHPDKHPDEKAVYEEKMKTINNAYDELKKFKGMN